MGVAILQYVQSYRVVSHYSTFYKLVSEWMDETHHIIINLFSLLIPLFIYFFFSIVNLQTFQLEFIFNRFSF